MSESAQLRQVVYGAIRQIEGLIAPIVDDMLDDFNLKAAQALTSAERQRYTDAYIQLHRHRDQVIQRFSLALRELIERDLNHDREPSAADAALDWHNLRLVDDEVMVEDVEAKRISSQIEAVAEWELRDLTQYLSALQGLSDPDASRNPLRPELLSKSLHRAVRDVAGDLGTRRMLSQTLGNAMTGALRKSYAQITEDLKQRNVRPLEYSSKPSEGTGYLGGLDAGPAPPRPYHPGQSAEEATAQAALTLSQALSTVFGSMSGGPAAPAVAQGGGEFAPPATMSRLRSIMEQLSELATELRGDSGGFSDSGFSDSSRRARSFAATRPMVRGSTVSPNLIRSHQSELQQATANEDYRRTIEVVAVLFDHILSDAELHPLMARLIARLQVPTLQLALHDPQLFVSPAHPLHALINRLGRAAVAFDEYDAGPGQRFYASSLTLVEEILESDYVLLSTYQHGLQRLENALKNEARTDSPYHGDAARLLSLKELRLHLEHHLRGQVGPVLAGMPVAPYLREFLESVWIQAQAESVMRFGEKSHETQRFQRMCSDLVWSVQPKNSADERKQLVAALPHLMRDVNDAFALLHWPPLQQKEFRARLLENHAVSMRGDESGAGVEGSGTMLAKRLRDLQLPSIEEVQSGTLAPGDLDASQCTFTDAEKAQIGLLTLDDFDGARLVDVPLWLDGDDEPPQPTEVMSHDEARALAQAMRPGDAYRLRLSEGWKKLRLAWVSDMRTFYVFTHSADHRSKVTLGAQTLTALWQRGDLVPHETLSLMSRAIAATRRQLAGPAAGA
ncbi:MAG: DUF1631 family protein [Betaproteobacteria bacterium]|nr:DUF1631 family protein [Betaproteobacteria bacterium]